MKTLAKIVGIGLLGGLSFGGPPDTRAEGNGAAPLQIRGPADFAAPLAAHGTWVEVRDYGRCWRPARVAVDWRPYCDGRWVWTDCGWYWESDEPWAWACYHYGSWVFDSNAGWVWLPGLEWAPAWVHWRVGDGFIGWAPRPPRGGVLAPIHFSFVATEQFAKPVRRASVLVNDARLVSKTREISEVMRVSREVRGERKEVVFNEGPGTTEIEHASGQKIIPLPVQDVMQRTARPRPPQSQEIPKLAPPEREPAERKPETKDAAVAPAEPKKIQPKPARPQRPKQDKGRPAGERARKP